MYRVYRGILQSREQLEMVHSKDSLNHCVISAGKDGNTSITFQQKRKVLTSESSPVPLNFDISNFDYCPWQSVELFANPDLVEECNVIDDSDIFVIITNRTATSDTTEIDEADNSTNTH